MPAYFDTLGSIPRAIAAVWLLLTAAWGLGVWWIDASRSTSSRRWETTLLRIAIGLNVLGVTGIVLGMTGGLAAGRSVWLLVAAAVAGVPHLRELRTQIPQWRDTRSRLPWGAWLFLLLAMITLGPALCYPTGWDEMVYHGVLPRRWLADGYPAVYHDLPYSAFPSMGEILFWLMAPVEAMIAPRLLIWVSWILGLLLLAALLRRCGAGRSSLWLTSCLAASPAMLLISANCYVESLLMMNVAALLLAAIRLRRRNGGVVLGILAGGAAAIKLTALVSLVLPPLWLVTQGPRAQRSLRDFLPCVGACMVLACAIGVPFYLRTWFATGNPVYPYYAAWFGGSPQSIAMSEYHHLIGDLGFGVRSIESFFVAPLMLGLHDQWYDGGFGWQWLILLGLGVWGFLCTIRRPRARLLAWPVVTTGLFYAAWYFTSQQGRFAIPMATALIAAASVGWRSVPPRAHRPVLLALFIASGVCLPWQTASYYAACWETVAGRWTWAEGLNDATRGKYVPLLQAVAEQTPPDARLLLVFEHRLLYLPRETQIGTPFFQERWFMLPGDFMSAEPVLAQLRSGDITHLVIAKSPVGPDWSPEFFERSQPIFRGLEAAMQTKQITLVWESDDYLLLAVHP